MYGGKIVSEKVPHYINDPVINAATAPELKLYRPKIHYWKAALYIFAHFAVGILIAMLFVGIKNGFASVTLPSIIGPALISTGILFLITLRFSFIWFVRLYQHYAKSETRLRCCMTPSCSEYAILALKKYGAIWGGIKTFKRLLRCHPPGGIDYP